MSKYRKIADDLITHIEKDDLKERKLPPERELGNIYQASRQTIREALSILAREGYIEKLRGSGSYISDPYFGAKNRIALLIENGEDYLYPSIITEFRNALMPHGYTFSVHETNGSFSEERKILSSLQKEMLRGIVSVPSKSALPCPNRDLYSALNARNIPVLFFRDSYPNLSSFFCVAEDEVFKSYALCRDLLTEDPSLTLYGIFLIDVSLSLHRFEGFSTAVTEFGGSFSEENVLFLTTEDLRKLRRDGRSEKILSYINQCMKKAAFFSGEDRLTFFCHNDEIAYHVYRYPDLFPAAGNASFGIASFDDSFLSRISDHKIRSAPSDIRGMAGDTVSRILNRQLFR